MIEKSKIKLKKGIACLLAATQIVLVSACGNYEEPNNEISSSINSSTISDNIYKTKNYALVYLDGTFYLATCKEVKDKAKNIYDYEDIQYNHEYYDAKTGELIGKVLQIAKNEIRPGVGPNAAYLDSNYYNGEYGYGKIIPSCSVTPLSNIVKSQDFTQEEFNFLTSNSEDLQTLIKGNISFDKRIVVDYFADFLLFYQSYAKKVNLYKYTCLDKNGKESVFIGYRCSYNENDLGFNYIYDIITGSIQYIGKVKENSFISVKAEKFDNKENKSVFELEQELVQKPSLEEPDNQYHETKPALDETEDKNEEISDNQSPETTEPDDSKVDNNLELKKEVFGEDDPNDSKYEASNIVVVDTRYVSCEDSLLQEFINPDEEFYILVSNQEDNENLKSRDYYDLLNNNHKATVADNCSSVVYDWDDCNYYNLRPSSKGGIYYLNDFLKVIGLEDIAKDVYSESELRNMLKYVKNNLMGVENSLYDASNLIIVDNSGKVLTGENPEPYYILEKLDRNVCADLNNQKAYVAIFNFDNMLYYQGSKCIISFINDGSSKCMFSLNEYLKSHGLDDLIKSEYTKEELENIWTYLNNNLGIAKALNR